MRLVYGFGINDADYVVKPTIGGKIVWCSYYRTWTDMLQRCYCKPWLQKRPTYRGCIVCNKWLTFSNFKLWMENQDWEGKQLDKDLLGNGKLYSPETCCFVPQWLNKLLNDNGRARGPYPIGVYFHKQHKKFGSSININGKHKHLGYFDTPEEPHLVYKIAKAKYVQNKMKDYPDQRIKQAVLNKAQNLYGEPSCVLC